MVAENGESQWTKKKSLVISVSCIYSSSDFFVWRSIVANQRNKRKYMNIIKYAHQCIRDAINLVPWQVWQANKYETYTFVYPHVGMYTVHWVCTLYRAEQAKIRINRVRGKKGIGLAHKKWWLSNNNISASAAPYSLLCASIYLMFFFSMRVSIVHSCPLWTTLYVCSVTVCWQCSHKTVCHFCIGRQMLEDFLSDKFAQ